MCSGEGRSGARLPPPSRPALRPSPEHDSGVTIRWRSLVAPGPFAALALVAPPGLDLAAQLHRDGIAVAVDGLAGGDADPAFGGAIFLHVLALLALEADADAALQRRHVEIRAARIVGEAVGGRVGH